MVKVVLTVAMLRAGKLSHSALCRGTSPPGPAEEANKPRVHLMERGMRSRLSTGTHCLRFPKVPCSLSVMVTTVNEMSQAQQ